MSTTPGQPRGINIRGAVDLSGLRRPAAGAAGPTGQAVDAGAPGTVPSVVVDVTSANFEQVLSLSATVPVVLDLWADWCQPCTQLSPVLEKLAVEGDGSWLLAKIDVEAEKEIAAMLRVQSLPTVLAVVGGRPVPLFQGAMPEAQVRQVLDELLAVAAQNGVNGRLTVTGDAAPAQPQDEPLPPLHQQAHDAIDNDDLDGAAEAFRAALAQNPADAEAAAGLAQVTLLLRVGESDPATVILAADSAPADLEAGLAAADIEVATGQLEAGFNRLIALIRGTAGDDRDRVRQRLLDLFEVAGGDDPRVTAARRALASALF